MAWNREVRVSWRHSRNLIRGAWALEVESPYRVLNAIPTEVLLRECTNAINTDADELANSICLWTKVVEPEISQAY